MSSNQNNEMTMMTRIESLERRLGFLMWGIGIISTIVLGMVLAFIPWAMSMHANAAKSSATLVSIQGTLSELKTREIPPGWFRDQVNDNRQALRNLETRIRDLEKGQ